MEIRNDAQYDEYFSADFWRIDIKLQDTIGHIYIGWNPDLKGDNDEWRQRKKENSIGLPVIVPLSGDQAGQFLGIPNGKRDPYFHLWFDKQGSEANDEILKLMGFC